MLLNMKLGVHRFNFETKYIFLDFYKKSIIYKGFKNVLGFVKSLQSKSNKIKTNMCFGLQLTQPQ
jgi:hypothetical protein